MSCSGCGPGATGASYPGFVPYPQTAACATATAGAGLPADQNIVVIGGTYAAIFAILKYAKRICRAGSASKIYWIYTGPNQGRANNVYGTTAEPSSVAYPHELSQNPAAFLAFPLIYSSATPIEGPGGDDDCDEGGGIVTQSSVVMYQEPAGQSVVANFPTIMDFGFFVGNATNAGLMSFLRCWTKVVAFSAAENAMVDALLSATSNPGAFASSFLVQGGAGFSRVHAFALDCQLGAPTSPQYLNSLKAKIYAAHSAGSRIVTLFPNLRPGTLRITPTGSTYTVAGTAGARDFSLTNVGLVRWAGTQMTNLMLQTYALQQPGETTRPLASIPVTVVGYLQCPSTFQDSTGATHAVAGATFTFTLADPTNAAGSSGVTSVFVRVDFASTSPDGLMFAAGPDYQIMTVTLVFITAARNFHFDPVNSRFVGQLLDCTTEQLLERTAAAIITEIYTLIFNGAPTQTPLTTLGGSCPGTGACARFTSFTSRPTKPTTLGHTLEVVADCFPTALCHLFSQ